jgi:hypothetical protein
MTNEPLITTINGQIRPGAVIEAWLRDAPDLRFQLNALGMVNPGMLVYLLVMGHHWGKPAERLHAFFRKGLRDQLDYVGLRPFPVLGRIMSKLVIDRVDTVNELEVLGEWLNREVESLPKALLHEPVLHQRYLEALMHQPLVECIPYPTRMGIDPNGAGNMDQLKSLLDEYERLTRDKGLDRRQLGAVLSVVRSVKDLENIVFALERDLLEVQLPLEPDSFIWAPRKLVEYKQLALAQQNCVHQYFRSAVQGKSVVYTVRDKHGVQLTAELRKANGFWYPTQVLAKRNQLPRPQDVHRLMRWLASSQIRADRRYSFKRNLARLMAWACARSVASAPGTGNEGHWMLQVEALSSLLVECQQQGLGVQLSLSLSAERSVPSNENTCLGNI